MRASKSVGIKWNLTGNVRDRLTCSGTAADIGWRLDIGLRLDIEGRWISWDRQAEEGMACMSPRIPEGIPARAPEGTSGGQPLESGSIECRPGTVAWS